MPVIARNEVSMIRHFSSPCDVVVSGRRLCTGRFEATVVSSDDAPPTGEEDEGMPVGRHSIRDAVLWLDVDQPQAYSQKFQEAHDFVELVLAKPVPVYSNNRRVVGTPVLRFDMQDGASFELKAILLM